MMESGINACACLKLYHEDHKGYEAVNHEKIISIFVHLHVLRGECEILHYFFI
jgi:hypothetical protein